MTGTASRRVDANGEPIDSNAVSTADVATVPGGYIVEEDSVDLVTRDTDGAIVLRRHDRDRGRFVGTTIQMESEAGRPTP